MRALLVASAVLVAAVLASSAGAARTGHGSLVDVQGDSGAAPDITTVVVGSHGGGTITWIVATANRQEPAVGDVFRIGVDTDVNAATGGPLEGQTGFEWEIVYEPRAAIEQRAFVRRWDGTQFATQTLPQSFVAYWFRGARISVNRQELAIAGPQVAFTVFASSTGQTDTAPEPPARAGYTLSTEPLRLTVQLFGTRKVQGQYITIMQVHRSDLDELLSDGAVRCTARIGKRTIRPRANEFGFVEDIAGCAWRFTRAHRKKIATITMTVTFEGMTVRRTARVRIR